MPFNFASYALLTHIIAAECNLEVGELIWSGGDVHIYDNHMQAVKTQLERSPESLPELEFTKKTNIADYVIEDFKLRAYNPQGKITAPIAV